MWDLTVSRSEVCPRGSSGSGIAASELVDALASVEAVSRRRASTSDAHDARLPDRGELSDVGRLCSGPTRRTARSVVTAPGAMVDEVVVVVEPSLRAGMAAVSVVVTRRYPTAAAVSVVVPDPVVPDGAGVVSVVWSSGTDVLAVVSVAVPDPVVPEGCRRVSRRAGGSCGRRASMLLPCGRQRRRAGARCPASSLPEPLQASQTPVQ